jgi:hypothetical protein
VGRIAVNHAKHRAARITVLPIRLDSPSGEKGGWRPGPSPLETHGGGPGEGEGPGAKRGSDLLGGGILVVVAEVELLEVG